MSIIQDEKKSRSWSDQRVLRRGLKLEVNVTLLLPINL